MDYDQFWLNLTQANLDRVANWTLEYSFKNYFQVPDLSYESFHQIWDKLDSDEEYFDKYYTINSVQKVDDLTCDQNCKAYHKCAILEQNYLLFDLCVALKSNSGVLQKEPSFLLVLTLIIFIINH